MRIGLLGGTFDPPHNGHLLGAGDAFDALSLDRVIFIPAATQPLKLGQASAPAADRLEMVKRLVDGDDRFGVSTIEIDRGGLSFTVDTLSVLSREWPSAELFWLVGADVLATFSKWREPSRILELATVAVLRRTNDAELSGMPEQAIVVESRRIDISSTEIRARVREGKSIRGFVPEAVAAHIAAVRLYR